ncbi:MAG: transglycosylase SLT domain-containing protein [Parvibaculum sp.]|uniref:transglycosylase SLT domain-containing protein n=1 Tax=Parvibaculum sp. TaxID=2024848 RepID=UPI002717E580|nr:transglycosylase SLT domain-containing protein [Parvibaculum sp.]MDO8838001.1 transglycosylase SLT domain-containing protein [Parvibaculum sp.]
MRTLWLWLSITAFAFLPFSSSAQPSFPDRYDAAIERAVKKWWGDFPDPLFWKAQLWQESRLDPAAVSPVGAAGVAQFMPGTWSDVTRRLGIPRGVSPHEAKFAIDAGAYYMATLRRQWHAERPEIDRHRLAQASYNAGLGNIVKAQRACGGARHWPDIAPCLVQVTGRHSKETLDYVRLIEHWRGRMAERGER